MQRGESSPRASAALPAFLSVPLDMLMMGRAAGALSALLFIHIGQLPVRPPKAAAASAATTCHAGACLDL